MIYGFFEADGHAYLEGHVYLPRFGVGEYVDFLVDTGADVTMLGPDDSETLNFPFDELENPISVSGVGGEQIYYDEPAADYTALIHSVIASCPTLAMAKLSRPKVSVAFLRSFPIFRSSRMSPSRLIATNSPV